MAQKLLLILFLLLHSSICFGAISYDTKGSDNDINPGSSSSVAITVAVNDNRILVGGGACQGGTSNNLTSATWNGDAMTFITYSNPGQGRGKLYYIIAPDEGTHNLVVYHHSSAESSAWGGLSIYGAAQEAPEANNRNEAEPGTTVSATIETLTDGAWLIDMANSDAGSRFLSPNSGQSEKFEEGVGKSHVAMGTEHIATAAATSASWNINVSENLGVMVASFKPYVEAAGARRIMLISKK